jgi:hypothetical protein
MRAWMALALVSGCASTHYNVQLAPYELARERGDLHARVPARLAETAEPVYVDAGALREDGGRRAHVVNRTMITGYVFLGMATAHVIPGATLLALGFRSGGSFSAIVDGTVTAFGIAYAVIGATLVLVGMHVRPHEWRRTVTRTAYLGPDGALHF